MLPVASAAPIKRDENITWPECPRRGGRAATIPPSSAVTSLIRAVLPGLTATRRRQQKEKGKASIERPAGEVLDEMLERRGVAERRVRRLTRRPDAAERRRERSEDEEEGEGDRSARRSGVDDMGADGGAAR